MRTTTLLLLFTAGASAATQLHYDSTLRRYSVQGDTAGVELARMGLEAGGSIRWTGDAHAARWNGQDEARFEFAAPAFRWTVRFRDAAGALLVSSSVDNTGAAPLKLGRCFLLDATDSRARIRMPADTVALTHTGNGYPARVTRLSDLAQPLEGRILAQWFSSTARAALQLGFVSFDRAETSVSSAWDPARRAPLAAAWSDFKGFTLAPHASIDAETLRIDLNPDPFASLEHWADAVHDRYQPRIWPTIPSGWLGWAWADPLTVERYEDVVLRNVRAIRRRLTGHDIGYVWVSLGNLQDRLPGNWLDWNRTLVELSPSEPVTAARITETMRRRGALAR